MTKNNYGNEKIRSLSDKEAMRFRPANNLGSDDINGVFHALKEIVDNSIDEVKAGYGSEVVITKDLDGFYEVKDSGRGVPMDWNTREEKFNYELVFMTLNAGGKYNTEEDGTFEFPKGLNGIGASACAFTSEHFTAHSIRDGHHYSLILHEGELVSFDKEVDNTSPTQTVIKWKPDLQVFKEIDIPFEWIKNFAKEQAVVNKGTKMIAVDRTTEQTYEFYYENGIVDYLDELSEGTRITQPQYFEVDTKGRDREDLPEYRVRLQIAFALNNEVNLLSSYHNSSYLKHGGSPHDAVKSAFAYAIHRYAVDQDLYKKQGKKLEKRITWDDIAESFIVLTNTYSMETSYANQTKLAITNEFIREYMNNWLREQLEIYFTENPKEAKTIVQQILINKRSSEQAETSRKAIHKKLSQEVNQFTSPVEKFINCSSNDPNIRELFILEGDSAATSVKSARDNSFQALYPLRGKITNVLKTSPSKVFENSTITDLVRLIGVGVETRDKKLKSLNTFDINKLTWKRIILTADQDVDGGHINALLLTFFYKYLPTLVEQGHVYIAVSPLFKLTYPNKKQVFAYNEDHLATVLKEHGKPTYIQRSKGLGENNAKVMRETVTDPETRNLIQVKMEDYEEMKPLFDTLMGDNLEERKKVVADYLGKYINQLD